MDKSSETALLAVEQNSNELTSLNLGVGYMDEKRVFKSSDSDDYNRLGTAVGTNTHLTSLKIHNLYNNITLNTANKQFYDGIRRNSSITELFIASINQDNVGVVHEVLMAFHGKNILTKLQINSTVYHRFMEDTLRVCTNLREIILHHCSITDYYLLPMVEAVRGHHFLEKFTLSGNYIEDAGCKALATLRNLTSLDIADNDIKNEGMIAIGNSLYENNHLRDLSINGRNEFDLRVVVDNFCSSLCNKLSINDIYTSNHTLESIKCHGLYGSRLATLLELNKSKRNKRHVAIKKILLYYTSEFDMEPLLSVKEDDSERDLKAMPHVISWFETAREAIIEDVPRAHNDLEIKKISAIYQFVTAMPMLFVPATHHDKGVDKKRKRNTD